MKNIITVILLVFIAIPAFGSSKNYKIINNPYKIVRLGVGHYCIFYQEKGSKRLIFLEKNFKLDFFKEIEDVSKNESRWIKLFFLDGKERIEIHVNSIKKDIARGKWKIERDEKRLVID